MSVQFIPDDPSLITAELVAAYEAATGKTLYPAQVERLFIDLLAYRETLVRSAINDVANQNLVAFARAPMLDYLGELVGTVRLPAQPARTTLRFTLADPASSPVLVPSGTRVQGAADAVFATQYDAIISAGQTFIDALALADTAGSSLNGILPGSISQPVGVLPAGMGASNISVTSGGAEQENDDRLRERIRLAPERFSVAGPRLAYRFAALSASQALTDCAVASTEPGRVSLYPLTADGLPSSDIKALVLSAVGADDVRPLCDQVEVLDPADYPFALSAQITLYDTADAATTLAASLSAAQSYAARIGATLGNDVVPSQIVAALSVPGVYQVTVSSPAADVAVPEHGWAHASSVAVTVAGVVRG